MKYPHRFLPHPALALGFALAAGLHLTPLASGQVGGGPVVHNGIPHAPLGQAQLQSEGEALVISNIGSSGEDGVRVDLGNSLCFQTGLRMPGETGWSAKTQAQATVGGTAGVPTAGFHMGFDPALNEGNTHFRPNFGNVPDEGMLAFDVFSRNGPPQRVVLPMSEQPEATFHVDSFFDITYQIELSAYSPKQDCERNRPFCMTGVKFPEKVGEIPIHLGDRTLVGDGLRISYIGSPLDPGTQTHNVAGILIGLSKPGNVALIGEHFQAGHNFQGIPFISMGTAKTELNANGNLVVSNIGSSGQDGVRIEFGDLPGGFRCKFSDQSGFYQGVDSFFDVWTEISVQGRDQHEFLAVSTRSNPTAAGVDLRALFGRASSSAAVEVWKDGELVQAFTGLESGPPLGRLTGPFQGLPRLGGCGKLGGLPPNQFPCFILPFPEGVEFTGLEGNAVPGDELRILATGLPAPIESIKHAVIFQGGGGNQRTVQTEIVSMDLTGARPTLEKIEPLPRFPGDDGGLLGRPRFKLIGHSFPRGPDDLCVVVPIGENLHLPMTVLGRPRPDCLIVEMPPIPPDLAPGIPCLLPGQGQRLPLPPKSSLYSRWAASFFGVGNGIKGAVGFPDPDPRDREIPPNRPWFFGPVEDNAICLTIAGDWLPHTVIDIRGHIAIALQNQPLPLHFDLSIHDLILPGSGTAEECAARLGTLLQLLFAQHFGLPPSFIKIEVIPGANGVKLAIQVIDPATQEPATLLQSGLAVCIRPPKPNPPVIHEVILTTPGEIRPHTVIKLIGENFGDSSDDLILEMCTLPRSTILLPVFVSDTCIIAKPGPIRPDSRPGPIKLYCGRGRTQAWVPRFADVEPETPSSIGFAPPFPPFEFDPFQGQRPTILVPPIDPPEQVDYIDGEVVNGRMCLRLDTDWGPNVYVSFLGIFRLGNDGGAGYFRIERTRLRGSGTRMECAERLKDMLQCAFDIPINVHCEEDPASGVVSLYFWIPDYPFLDGSNTQLCVFHPFTPPPLELVSTLTPGPLQTGSLIQIAGGGFPRDPSGLCVAFGEVPVQVVSNINGQLIGRVGLTPPGAQFGPLTLEAGRGHRGLLLPAVQQALLLPAVQGVRAGGPRPPGVPIQVFVGDGAGPALQTLPALDLRPPVQDSQVQYFRAQPGPNGELCLILEGDWCRDAVISFEGHIAKGSRNDFPPLTFDFFVRDLKVAGGPVEDCARLLKDLPACGLEQLACARRMLIWDCEPLGDPDQNGDNAVKIIVRCPFGNPLSGNMTLCIRCPLPDLEIKSVTTVDGGPPICLRECDLICIEACYAGTDPKDLCAQIGIRPGNITPLTVREIIPGLDGAPDKIIAQVGQVPPNAFPAPVFITRGEGNCGIWQPGVATLDRPTRPGWVFDSLGNPTARSERRVGRKPSTDQPPTERCFTGLPNDDRSAICLDLVGAWLPGSIIKVRGHLTVFTETHAIGRDISSPITRTSQGGTAEDCARALKDIFRCQFDQLAELSEIRIECPPDNDNDPNTATVKFIPVAPDVRISGHINVCVCAPPGEPKVDQIIANPNGVCPGDTICIIGSGFSPRPDDYCVTVGEGNDAFSLTVTEVVALDDGRFKLICQVDVIPPQLTNRGALPLYIGIAHGKRVAFAEVVPGMASDANPWVWSNPGNFPVLCIPDAIVPAPKDPPSDERWFHAVIGQNGEMCITIPAGIVWKPQQVVEMNGHIHLPPPFGHIDIRSKRVRLRGGGTPEDCARAITDVLRCVFQQLEGFGLVDISWQVNQGEIKITLKWPETDRQTNRPFPLNGFLVICLVEPPQAPSGIDNDPMEIRPGSTITVRGEGFGNTPDDLCMVVRLRDGQRIPVRVLEVGNGVLTGRVGPIPPNARGPGCIEVMRGKGNVVAPGRVQFAFDQIRPDEPVWAWNGINPDAKAKGPDNIVPIPTDPPAGQRWFYSRIVNGSLVVVLEGDWEEDSKVQVTARAHNACQRLDLDAPQTTFLGKGTAAECARLLKDFLVKTFRQQTGEIVKVSCHPVPGANAVRLVIELENGKPIDWGLCTICVSPVPATSGDRDNDGIPDNEEAQYGTDPDVADTDGDGLLDGAEVFVHKTNPRRRDTDGDGCPDGEEIAIGLDPTDPEDCLIIDLVSIDPNTGQIRACIPRTLPGRIYSILCGPSLDELVPVNGARDLFADFDPDTQQAAPIDLMIDGLTGPRKFIVVQARNP